MEGIRKHIAIAFLAAVSAVGIAGCKGGSLDSGTKIVFTTGFEKDEVFRIEKSSCTLAEMMVYMANSKNQYETAYGKEIWQASYNGETLEENIKDTVLARLARVKTMNLLAQGHEISLSEEEAGKAKTAARDYFTSLSEKEIELLGVDEALIQKMYEEYALAEKVYQYLIADINPEISDDEARTITVQHILIKTYAMNENGERVPYSESAKNAARQKAREALKRASDGEEFSSLIAEYSEDSNVSYSFGKGMLEQKFEEAAFNLGTDEISGIVETSQGYHIIKCISAFDKDETDRNKIKIVEQRRKEVFNEEYSSFAGALKKNINEELWDSLHFIEDEDVATSSFFEAYRLAFGT